MKATALQFYLGMDLPWSSTITKSYFCVLVEVTKLLSFSLFKRKFGEPAGLCVGDTAKVTGDKGLG